jgi:hypothetical protein
LIKATIHEHYQKVIAKIASRYFNPVSKKLAGRFPPWDQIYHIGRISGRKYFTPIVSVPIEGGYIIPLPYGKDTDWCKNIRASNKFKLIRLKKVIPLKNPTVIGKEEALAAFPPLLGSLINLSGCELYLRSEIG